MVLVRGSRFVAAFSLLVACGGGKPDVPIVVGNGGSGGGTGTGGTSPSSGGNVVVFPDAGAAGEGMGTGGAPSDPCADLACGKGHRHGILHREVAVQEE